MNEERQAIVAVGVVQRRGEILLVRQRAPQEGIVWQFPAGKVEAGEAVELAAVREVLEETGVRVEPVATIGARRHPATGRRLVYIACHWLSGTPRPAAPREVAEAEWVSVDELRRRVPHGVYGPVWDYVAGPALP